MIANKRAAWVWVWGVAWIVGVAFSSKGLATDGNWNANAADNWSNAVRWTSNPDIPGGVGSVVGLTFDITASRTITINTTSRTVGILNVGDADGSNSYTLAASGGGALIFDNGVSVAQLNQLSASFTNTISAPVVLDGSLDIGNASASLLTISGGVTAGSAGTKTITNMGSGSGSVSFTGIIGDGSGVVAVRQNSVTSTLVLGGVNTFSGGVTLDSGTLSINNGGALGSGTLTLNGGTMIASADRTITTNNAQSWNADFSVGSAFSLNMGTGVVTISGTRTVTNAITASGKTFTVGGAVGGTGNLIFENDSLGATTLSGAVNHIGSIQNNGTGTGIVTVSGTIGSNVTGITQDSLTSILAIGVGNGTANPDFAGSVTINRGDLRALATGVLGSGTVYLGATSGTDDATLRNGTVFSSTLTNNIEVRAGSSGTLTVAADNTSGSMNFSGSVALNNDLTFQRNSNGNVTFSGAVSGTGDLTLKNNGGSGSYSVTGSLNHAGEIINSGSGTGSVSLTSTSTVGANVTGIIQNSSTSTLVINGNNSSYAGNVDIQAGTLSVTSSNGLSAANTVEVDSGTTFNLGVGTLTIAGLNGSGNVTKTDGASRTLTLGGSGVYNHSGVISNAANTYNLAKTGSGTQVLSGTNTYNGTTTVSGGTLLIDGDSSGATGAVTVSTAALGGSGIVGGSTTFNSGGILSPGNSPGTLTFEANLTLNNGSTYVFEAGDLVAVGGILDLNDNWTLSLQSGFVDGGSVTLFTYGTLALSPDLFPTFDISALGFTPGSALSLTDTGSSIVLNGISAVPEPSTYALFGLGLGTLWLLRRKKFKVEV